MIIGSTLSEASDTNHSEITMYPLSQGIQGQMDNPSWMESEAKESANTSPLDHELGDQCNNDPDDAQISDSRVQYVESIFDESGRRVENPGRRPTMPNTQENSDLAFVVKEIWGDNSKYNNGKENKENNGKDKKIEIILKGQELRNIVQDVIGNHLEHDRRSDWAAKEQTLEIPFCSEIRCLNELSKATQSCRGSEQGRNDLKLLLKHLQYLRPDVVKLVESIHNVGKVLPNDLWYLFRPGDLVVSKHYLDEPQLFRINDCRWINHERHDMFEVVAWAFDWTGDQLTPHYYTFQHRIPKKSGERDEKIDILDLPCYPIRYYKNNEGLSGDGVLKALFTELVARGQEFRNICRKSANGKQYKYDGELLYVPQPSRLRNDPLLHIIRMSEEKAKRLTLAENIMVDFAAYKMYGPNAGCAVGDLPPQPIAPCTCKLCFDERTNCNHWMQDFGKEDGKDDTAEEKENYWLVPARALGYSLHRKIWAQFHVRRVNPVDTPSSDAFSEELIFPEALKAAKEDLKTLVEQHRKPVEHMFGDPIAGKGCGLVVLLHGPPGVGKTFTAETLAQSSGRPLYVVGASDIGLEPRQAEKTLDDIFELAEKWQAILLIDEADVYLDSRGSKGEADVSKNALVSVMLRILEYFKGILIMTTNRIMTFDVAMLSRCHYAIDFKTLSQDQEQKIWERYMAKLDERNSEKKDEIEDWVKQITKRPTKLSGREIRNVFTTAQTLAQAEHNKKIKKDHLERVYDRLTDFVDAMEVTKNKEQLRLNTAGN